MNAKIHAQTDGKPKKTTNPIYLMGGKKNPTWKKQ